MRTIGNYSGAGRTIDGNLTITFEIDDDLKALENFKGFGTADLVIEVNKYHEKRGLDANAYFWVLVDKIARALGSDKDTVYLLQLHKYGVFVDMKVKPGDVEVLKKQFRLAEAWEEYPDAYGNVRVRCYIGSSHYDKAQMSYLIDGTVNDAKDLNIDTWTQDEIARLLAAMGGRNDAKGNNT